jgi:hypothetical protein
MLMTRQVTTATPALPEGISLGNAQGGSSLRRLPGGGKARAGDAMSKRWRAASVARGGAATAGEALISLW